MTAAEARCLRLRHTFKSHTPPNGIRKSSSSNEPFPPSGEIPKSRSKKSMQVSRLGHIPQGIVEISLSAVKDPAVGNPYRSAGSKGVNQFTEAAIAKLLSIDIAPKQAVSGLPRSGVRRQ